MTIWCPVISGNSVHVWINLLGPSSGHCVKTLPAEPPYNWLPRHLTLPPFPITEFACHSSSFLQPTLRNRNLGCQMPLLETFGDCACVRCPFKINLLFLELGLSRSFLSCHISLGVWSGKQGLSGGAYVHPTSTELHLCLGRESVSLSFGRIVTSSLRGTLGYCPRLKGPLCAFFQVRKEFGPYFLAALIRGDHMAPDRPRGVQLQALFKLLF